MKFPIALASATMAAALGLAPTAQASAKDPVASVVFLGGTGTGYVPSGPTAPPQFISPFVPAPFKALNHVYDGSPLATPQSSVPELLKMIASQQAQGNRVTVVGLSKGAQVGTAALHDPNAPQGVDYVFIGNPDRDGGANTAMGWRPAYGETKANVHEVFGQYDGFAEVPNPANVLAVANAAMGIVYVHFAYGTGGANDPLTHLGEATSTVKDNLDANGKPNGTTTTTTRIPTKDLPLTRPLRDTLKTWHLGTDGLDAFDAAIRPVIDAGYKPAAPSPVAKAAPEVKASPVAAVKNETPAQTDKPAKATKPTRAERQESKNAQRTERQEAKKAQREERRAAREAKKADAGTTSATGTETKASKPAKEHHNTKKENHDNG